MRTWRWGLFLASMVAIGDVRQIPTAGAAPEASHEVGLSASVPATRAASARALGASYAVGAPLADVLATMALEDEETTVRAAAAEALETLAVSAAERWRLWLAEARLKPYEHDDYRAVADEMLRLGHVAMPMDLAAGLSSVRLDARRADTLAAALLLLRLGPEGFSPYSRGLDVLLESAAATEGPRTAATAHDLLVVLACSRIRLAGAGAPGPAPKTTLGAASWEALLTPKGTPWFSASAQVVLGAVGRPGDEVLSKLVRDGGFEALGLLGQAGASVGHLLGAGVGNPELTPWARRRLGVVEGVLPDPPGLTAEERHRFARACAHLAVIDPERVRTALPTLAELLARRAEVEVREAALLAIARVPELPKAVREVLARVAAEKDQDGTAALARWALLQGTDDATALHGLLEALETTIDAQGLRLKALTPFLREALRAFGEHAARLAPGRTRLEALLVEYLVPHDVRLAIVGALGRMQEADGETVRCFQELLTRDGWFTDDQSRLVPRPLPDHVLRYSRMATRPTELRREVASALRRMGPRAASARVDLDQLSRDPDAVVRWHALRALADLARR